MRCFLFSILLITATQIGFAQVTYPISSYASTPSAFHYLLLTNQQIEDNDTINEVIADLVTPMVRDSVLATKKKAHHRLFLVGWLINKFGGYGWRPVEPVKQKFVGTVREDGHSSEEEYTEYDINYTLLFHQRYYLLKTFKAYDKQAHVHRQDIRSAVMPKKHRPKNYKIPPFVRDTNSLNINQYGLHCEVTPPRAFRPMLNYLFYPVLGGYGMKEHPNMLNSHLTMGLYGASCLDCNHACHPEIHPYEWIWWMNLHAGSPKDKTWLVGLFNESSNRFPGWSENPKTGKVRIPFAFEVKDRNSKDRIITIEHLVFGRFVDSTLVKLNMPDSVFNANNKTIEVKLIDNKGGEIPITVSFNNVLIGSALRYWFSDVNWDEQNHILSGFINMGTSVNDVYTMRMTMSCP